MKGSKNKKIVAIVSVLVIIAVGVVLAVYFANSTSIEKYIAKDLVAHGIDGYGKISESDVFDDDTLLETLGQDYYEWLYKNSYSDPLENTIKINIDKESNLSNGDTVTVRFRINYDRINSFKFNKKLRGKKEIEKTYTVSGLTEPKTVDLFAAVKQVNDKAGVLSVELDTSYYKEDEGFAVMYENGKLILRDPSGNYIAELDLAISDSEPDNSGRVTVVAEISGYNSWGAKYNNIIEDKYRYAEHGFILAATQKDFKAVEWETINNAGELNGKLFDDMKAHALSAASDAVPDNWTNISLENLFYYNDPDDPCILAIFAFTRHSYGGSTEASFFAAELYNIVTYGENVDFGHLEYDDELDDYFEDLRDIRSDSDFTEIKFK